MAGKKLTEEEMNHHRANPCVLDVHPKLVHFSAKYKELLWNAMHEGKKPRDIVIELDIDPEILGEYRVVGLKCMIRNEVRAG